MDTPAPLLAKITPPERPLGLLRLFGTVARNPMQAWPAAVYQEPLFHVSRFGESGAFVMHPDLIRQVLVDQADAFEKSEVTRRALGPALGDAILTANGARWRWQRRAAAPIFRHDRIQSFVPAMAEAAGRTRARWLAQSPGAEIDVAHEMMRTTFDIIVETMLSGRASIDVEAVERATTAYLDSVSWVIALTIVHAPRWVPYPGLLRARRARGYLRQMLAGLIGEARRSPVARNDLLSLLIAATDPETGRTMSDVDLADNLLTFITAGHETTALALTWTFYLLSLHPDVERRVVDEIDAVTAGAPLGPQHVEALAYTRQVLMEAMRLYPPAPLVVRSALRAVSLGGETLARGSQIYVPIYAVHRHAALWDDPDRFDPDRFRPEAVRARDRYAYLPFGAGPRVCIGMSFALTEATVVLATLLRAVRLALRPGHRPKLKMRVTLRPAGGMPMRIAPR